MSQAKVDRYKEEKANRKKTMARNKVKRMVTIVCTWCVVIVLAAWIGVSVVKKYEASKPIDTHYVEGAAVQEFLDYAEGADTDEKESTEK